MPIPEYRVLLRGLKDETESGRRLFLQRFGEAYKMSPEQAAQWLKSRKGVIYVVKTAEAAEKAKRYVETLGGVAEIEKTAEAEAAPPSTEPARLDLATEPGAPAAAAATAAAAVAAAVAPEVPGQDAFVPAAPSVPVAVQPSATGAPLRLCPHCSYPYPQDQAACPACRRPPVYGGGGATAVGPGAARPAGPRQGYDLSAIVNLTIETYKNNFVTLYALSVAPMVLITGIAALAVIGLVPLAALGKDAVVVGVAVGFALAVILLPLVIYASSYLMAALVAAIDVALRGERSDPIGIIKAIPPMLPLKMMVNGAVVVLAMLGVMLPFLGITIFAATQKMVGLAVVSALPILPLVIVVTLFFMLVMPVTVLEGQWAVDALRRSKELGQGYYLRNFGIMFIISMAVAILVGIVSMPIQMIPILGPLLSPLVQALATPVTTIPIVLLYYDMRLKKG